MGHINKYHLINMANKGTLSNLKYDDIDWTDKHNCLICAKSKITQRKVPKQADRSEDQPFKTVSMDIYGMISTKSVGGNTYTIICCDNETSYGLIEFTKSKENEELIETISNIKLQV
jgi:hypothetical protein